MAGKQTAARRIDAPLRQEGGDTLDVSAEDQAPPAQRAAEAPENLALDSDLVRSAVTPEALVTATWEYLNGAVIDQFLVQISQSPAFPEDATRTLYTPGDQLSATVTALMTGTAYSVRVAAIIKAATSAWSDTATLTTDNDTVAPGPVTSAGYDFTSGDLLLAWTSPASDNFRHVRVDIYASNGGAHLHTFFTADRHSTYPAAQNLVDTSGAGDPSLYVILTTVSWFGVDCLVPVTLSPVKSVPTAPAGPASSWDSDTGAAGPDLKVTWTSANYIDHYVLTLDGVARTVGGKTNQYTLTLDANRFEHAGTPDKVISISLVAYDALGQPGPAATLTATNAAPAAPTVSATANIAQAQATVTSTPPGDFDVYEFVWRDSGGSTVRTAYSQSVTDSYQVTLVDTYSVVVRTRDVFGSYSPTTTVGSLDVTLTLTSLRSDSAYSDSIGTDFSSAPNATVLKDDEVGAGISYAASASAWRWTKITYPLTDRFRRIPLKLGSGAANVYVGLSSDDVTYTWYSGTVSSGYILTSVANEAAAQAAAPLFSALTYGWAELPATVEARYITIGHRNTTTGYRIDEAYGQRWVIADVIKAGDIQTLHIGAGQVTAGKISVVNLSAINADLGSITAGTITGALIRTAASGERLEFTSSALDGYTASGQFITINPLEGVSITVDTAASIVRAYTFSGSVGPGSAGFYDWEDTLGNYAQLDARSVPGKTTLLQLLSDGDELANLALSVSTTGGNNVDIEMIGDDGAGTAQIFLYNDTFIIGGLNVGSATDAAAGTIRASGYTAGSVLFQGASDAISQDNANFFWDDTNNRLGIGTAAPAVRLTLKGTDSSLAAGPHWETIGSADAYPITQLLSFTHDNIELSFDAYYDSGWKSSDAGSNFQIRKNADTFGVWYDSGVTAGSTVTWVEGLRIGITGIVSSLGAVRAYGNFVSSKGGVDYTGYLYVPLTAPLTDTAWDGDARSTTAKTLIDLSAVFGAPAGVQAISVDVVIRDSGSASTDCRLYLGDDNTAGSGQTFQCSTVNDRLTPASAIVACNANGDIYYQVAASGASTLDAWVYITGYWI